MSPRGKILRRVLVVAGLAVSAAAVIYFLLGRSRHPDLTIIHTGDLKGFVFPSRVPGWNVRSGGYAVFASWLEEVRAENRRIGVPTLLFDAGDIFSGTPEGHFDKGKSVIDLMNSVGYDLMAVGAGDLEFGYLNLVRLADRANFPLLASTAVRRGTSETAGFAHPCLTREVDGVKIGVFGVMAPGINQAALPGDLDHLDFQDPVEAARICVERLVDRGCDLIVALSHLGFDGNLDLARRVKGIDIIIGGGGGGHLRKPFREPSSGTLICQLEGYGRYAGRIDLWVGREGVRRQRYNHFVNLEWSRPNHLEVGTRLTGLRNDMGAGWNRVLGLALQEIRSRPDRESPLGNLVADAIRRSAGAEVALHEPSAIRAPLLEGDVTKRDVFHVLPENRLIVFMEMKGGRLREILEKNLTGGGLIKIQVSGLTARYDASLPKGERIVSLEVGSSGLEEDRWYGVAVPDIMAMNPDYVHIFREGRNWSLTGVIVRDALADLIAGSEPLFFGTFRPSRILPVSGGRTAG